MNANPLHSQIETARPTRTGPLYWRIHDAVFCTLSRYLTGAWPKHTLTLLVISTGCSLFYLAAVNLLWLAGLIPDPYHPAGLNGRHVVIAVGVFICVEGNIFIVRRRFCTAAPVLPAASSTDIGCVAAFLGIAAGAFLVTYAAATLVL